MFIKKIIEEKEHLKKINEEWAKMDEKWKHSCFAQKRPSSNNTLEPPPKKPKKDQPFEEAKAEKGKKSVSWSLC